MNGQADALEIEITPAMLDAGVEAYCLYQRGDPSEDIVLAIYQSMARLKRRRYTSLSEGGSMFFNPFVTTQVDHCTEEYSLSYKRAQESLGGVIKQFIHSRGVQ